MVLIDLSNPDWILAAAALCGGAAFLWRFFTRRYWIRAARKIKERQLYGAPERTDPKTGAVLEVAVTGHEDRLCAVEEGLSAIETAFGRHRDHPPGPPPWGET